MIPEIMYQALLAESKKIGVFGHGFTYGGHPVSAAVALKTLEIYARDRRSSTKPPNTRRSSKPGSQALGEHPLVGEARGLGLIGGVELVADKRQQAFVRRRSMASAPAPCISPKQEGLIVRSVMGDVLTLSPPLVISAAEIDELFDRLSRALDKTLDWVTRERLAQG